MFGSSVILILPHLGSRVAGKHLDSTPMLLALDDLHAQIARLQWRVRILTCLQGAGTGRPADNPVVALITSRLSNSQGGAKVSSSYDRHLPSCYPTLTCDRQLANNQENVRLGDSPPLEMILARLSEQRDVLVQQSEALKFAADDGKNHPRGLEHTSSSNSVPITPASDVFPSTGPTTRPASASVNQGDASSEEVLHLKLRLAEAQAKLSRLEDKSDSQGFKPEMDQGQGHGGHGQVSAPSHENIWVNEDSYTDPGDALTIVPPSNRAPSGVLLSGNPRGSMHDMGMPPPSSESSNGSTWFGPRNSFSQPFMDSSNPYAPVDSYRSSDRLTPDSDLFFRPPGGRRANRFDSRYASPGPFSGPYGPGPYNQTVGQYDIVPTQPSGSGQIVPGTQGMSMGTYPGYQPQSMTSALSPHATEFTSGSGWKNEVCPLILWPEIFSASLSTNYKYRRSLRRARPIYPRPSLSTTAASSTAMSIATGSTLSTRSSATMISRHPSSSSKSSRSARPSRSMTLSKPSSPRRIP